jgi:hypothetical protein
MVALFHGSLWLSLSQHRSDALMRSGSLMAALLSALYMTSCFIHSFIHSCAPKLPQHLLFQPLTFGGEGRNRTETPARVRKLPLGNQRLTALIRLIITDVKMTCKNFLSLLRTYPLTTHPLGS